MPRQTTAELLAAQTAILERLERDFSADRAERKADAAEAQSSREAVREELQGITARQEALDNRLSKVEPIAAMATSYQARVTGALFVLGFIGSSILFVLTVFKDKIMQALGW